MVDVPTWRTRKCPLASWVISTPDAANPANFVPARWTRKSCVGMIPFFASFTAPLFTNLSVNTHFSISQRGFCLFVAPLAVQRLPVVPGFFASLVSSSSSACNSAFTKNSIKKQKKRNVTLTRNLYTIDRVSVVSGVLPRFLLLRYGKLSPKWVHRHYRLLITLECGSAD